MMAETDLVERLRTRAKIRREIPGRKSVQAGEPDRIANLLDEAADEIEVLRHGPGLGLRLLADHKFFTKLSGPEAMRKAADIVDDLVRPYGATRKVTT